MINIKQKSLDLLARCIPRPLCRPLVKRLGARDPSFSVEIREYLRLDYDRHEIFLYRGIRANACAKEPETVRWIEQELRPGDILYDIGANIGAYSLVAAKHFQGQVPVYAFEPAYHTYPILIDNILRNQCQTVIRAMNVAIAESSKLSGFNYKSLRPGTSIHAFDQPIYHKGQYCPPEFEQLMISVSLDDLVFRHRLPPPTHIKLDVDGTEMQILRGAHQLLQAGGVKSCLLECEDHGEKTEAMIKVMAEYGYRFNAKGHHVKGIDNFIFSKKELMTTVI